MEKLIAKDLLSIGAVFLRPDQPFTWASGIKSPIYCDNRLTLTAVEVRKHVEAGLAEIVRTKFPEAEVLMGTSTAGIAHAAITATILDMPMGYVRSGQKDHGRGNQIEGKLEKGQKVVVIEDLISTGGSCIEVVNALREAGAEVLMGTSTAGIAHAAITATILDMPMGYVRSGQKDHGRGNQIEGKLEKGQKVVVIEDLISTGGSCIEVVNALREAGAEVLGVASIFTYGMKKGLDRMAEANVINYSLSNLDALVEVAAEEGYIKEEDKARLIQFRNNPSDESWMAK